MNSLLSQRSSVFSPIRQKIMSVPKKKKTYFNLDNPLLLPIPQKSMIVPLAIRRHGRKSRPAKLLDADDRLANVGVLGKQMLAYVQREQLRAQNVRRRLCQIFQTRSGDLAKKKKKKRDLVSQYMIFLTCVCVG
jgi:hypothetical protein